MNNEIGRKITSLTLMTIMLAAGFTAFAPGIMPQAEAANANLFVSAENSMFNNYFAGPQVIEVVINDSDIKDTDQAKGEPDVTINGAKLRMVQATDGNWYAYFADRVQAERADDIPAMVGLANNKTSTDFGNFCSNDASSVISGFTFTSTTGIAFAGNLTYGLNGVQTTLNACKYITGASGSGNQEDLNNVVRENKTLNRAVTSKLGNVITSSARNSQAVDQLWPWIQLYDFSAGQNVVVQYNKGGGVQSTTLTFDTIPSNLIGISTERTIYPKGAYVHATMTDPQLNIDPTDEDSWTFSALSGSTAIRYNVFDEDGVAGSGQGNTGSTTNPSLQGNLTSLMFESNGILTIDKDTGSTGTDVLELCDNGDSVLTAGCVDIDSQTTIATGAKYPVHFTETGPNTGIFSTSDSSDVSALKVSSSAKRDSTATIAYNSNSKSVIVGNFFGTIEIDSEAAGSEWNSGEEIAVKLIDQDQNLNGYADEDLDVRSANATLIPALKVGAPLTLKNASACSVTGTGAAQTMTKSIDTYSDRLICKIGTAHTFASTTSGNFINITTAHTGTDLHAWAAANATSSWGSNTGNAVRHFLSFDVRSINEDALSSQAKLLNVFIGNSTYPRHFKITLSDTSDFQQIINLGGVTTSSGHVTNFTANKFFGPTSSGAVIIGFKVQAATTDTTFDGGDWLPITADFLRFGVQNDGNAASERFNDAIYRLELEETGDNTGEFIGSMEYVMLNQINVNQTATYTGLKLIDDEITLIAGEDLTAEDSIRINYYDLGRDGVSTQISSQIEAPTHSAVVSFDKPTYKKADTVTITLEDQDLNVDSGLLDIYTVISSSNDLAYDTVGKAGYGRFSSTSTPYGQLLEVTYDDERWLNTNQKGTGTVTCTDSISSDDGLGETGFTLVETGVDTGILIGDYQIPANYCARASGTGTVTSTTGKDMEVNYIDFRDASGEIVEVGDGAAVRANTGSVSFDRTVYPVPFGVLDDTSSGTTSATGSARLSVFPLHGKAISGNVDSTTETINGGDLTLHVQVNDPDYDVSAAGEDTISEAGGTASHGPVKVYTSRGSSSVLLATAGFSSTTGTNGRITVGTTNIDNTGIQTRELGPIVETAPSTGIFEFDLTVRYTDGPASATCPSSGKFLSLTNSTRSTSDTFRFDTAASSGTNYCILQGDIITVEYRDATDASGNVNTITDSATFDLRNGALQSDKSVYIIGSDMILTLIEPDFDRDNDTAETYDLDLIEWDSDAADCTIGDKKTVGGCASTDSFDPEPSDFRETGDSTGIFQSVLEIPSSLASTNLERGEKIALEYKDYGPSGADYVGDENEDINLDIFTSNFGATVELDQKIYTWTDKVYITVVAPDHNMDSNLIDTIGDTNSDPVTVTTRTAKLTEYHLLETGVDTGIFTGEVILTGFAFDADGDSTTGSSGNDAPNFTGASSSDSTSQDLGPTNGNLKTSDDDGVTVSFEYTEDDTVVGSALIRWNIGEVSWLEASYPAIGTGVVRVIDPDMNLQPESVDNFKVDVYSDSDSGGIDLTVTETNEATGIFEGVVYFTTADSSSGARLRVAEGDTVTAEYSDNTLPAPYTTADELDITGTAFIGTVVPPLERAPASNARVVDAFGNTLDEVSVDQQVQVTADLTNGQDREQAFAYLVQVQDENGVSVALAWISGSLSAGQSLSPALSWIPSTSGTYTATVFVWESVDNPTALSPTVSVDITVS